MNLDAAARHPLWWDAVVAAPTRRALPGDTDADVAILGAGYTGLWTAYYLAKADPSLRIVVIERRHVGFGASGRNGGWCHAAYPLGIGVLAKDHGKAQALRQIRALAGAVDEVGRVCNEEGIDCHYAKGGVLTLARSALHLRHVEEEVSEARSIGLSEDDLRRLSQSEAATMLNATDVVGGVWFAHGAAIQPALLVHGLADACERRGIVIYEGTAATSIEPGRIRTKLGTLRADMIVRATAGYTSDLPGHERTIAPLYSLMIATEPLPEHTWQEIGLESRATFGDYRNLIIYGQRTLDGRLAFGGRGAPYYFGSRVTDVQDIHDGVHQELTRALVELLPQVEGAEVTHRWGGALGVSRDWRPSVSIDRPQGVAWAGGYVGDGVATAALAGRTLAELILDHPTERTTLPWVNHSWPSWEPEPLRWLGINAGLWMAKQADSNEERTGRASKLAALGNWLRGKSR